jgi:hypothetical protein
MIRQICDSVKALYPILRWHGWLKQQSADNVVGGAHHAFNFTILRRGVWTGHPELHAMGKEELP